MKFDWTNFTEVDFDDYCIKAKNNSITSEDYIGCVRVGDLCFDLLISYDQHGKMFLAYDLYVGGVDTGYGCTASDYPYDYAEGGNFEGTENIRQALTAIAEATQTIFYINYENKLIFKRLNKDSQPVLTIDKEKYFELLSKDAVEITKLAHATELGDNVEAGLRGYKSGAIVTANDVINESHEVKVSVNSRNLISYPYLETLPITREGITFSDNGDGGIVVTGTATGFAAFRLCDGSFLRVGQSYQFSEAIYNSTGSIRLHLAYYDENGAVKYAQDSPFVWKEEYKSDY